MSRAKELAQNTTILLIGRISTRAVNFFLLPLYTAYLSESEYGVVDLVATLIALLCPIVGLQLENAVFRYMIPERTNIINLSKIISSSLIAQIILYFLYCIIFFLISPFIHNEFKYYLLSNVIIASLLTLFLQILRGLGKNIDYAVASFISSVGVIIFNIWFLVGLNWGAYGMLSAMIGGNLTALIYCFIRINLWKYFSFKKFNLAYLRELLNYSVPLIPNELSWWAIRASDRVIVSIFLGLAATGIISIGHKFPEIFMTIFSVFGLAWTESIVLHIKEKDGEEYFARMSDTIIKFFSSISLIIVAAIPLAFNLLVNGKFDDAYSLIPIYFMGVNINMVIGVISVVYIAHRKTKTIAKTATFGAVISILSCIGLIKLIGIYASPVSFIIGFGGMMIYRCIDMRKLVKMNWDFKFITEYLFCYLVICACYYYNELTVTLIGIIISLGCFWHLNKKNMFIIKNMIKR